MNRRNDLRDRLFQEMLASDRGWSSVEIAQSALKIVSEPRRAEHLVTAILGGDPRFEKSGAAWKARATQLPRLTDHPYLLADASRPRTKGQAVTIFFRAHRSPNANGGELLEVRPDGSGLERLGPLLEEHQIASMSAPAVRHQLHWLESVHALPTASDSVLDLAAALALDKEPIPDAFGRESIVSVEERLTVCRDILERLFERHGAATVSDLERKITEAQGGEPIDFETFRFGPEMLEETPEQPGVYRFFGEQETLLYVGKSRNLRRRLLSYFRPLGPDHLRRRELLSRTRDLEWQVVPSELEALVLENEAIRTEKPLLNKKIETHPETENLAAADRDLAFVVADAAADEVSLFLLVDGQARARARISRGVERGARDRLAGIVQAWMSGGPFSVSPLVPIEPPESLLVLRYLKIFGDRVTRLRLADFGDSEQIVEALAGLAERPGPDSDALLVRGPRPLGS